MEKGRFLLIALREGDDASSAEYLDFVESTGLSMEALDHVVVTSTEAALPDLSLYDGIFVGGSPFNITDWEHSPVQKHAHDLVYSVLQSATPTFLTCFGASFTAFALGGEVDRKYGESAGLTTVRINEVGKRDPVVRAVDSEFLALTGHKEAVSSLPPGAQLLASGPTCPFQIYRVLENNWVTQFHPEMNAEGLLRRMRIYAEEGYFEQAEFDAIAELIRAADLSVVSRIIPAFVEYCRHRDL